MANLTKGAQTPEKLAGALAKALSTKAVYYEYSSFSGSTHYRMYDGAEEVEYLDVMDPDDAKLVLEHSKEMTAEGRKVFEGIREGDGVRFKSAKRKLTGDEKKDGDIFVNRAMKEEDALIPDLAGSFLGEAGKKMDFGDVPFGKEDVVGMVVVQGDNAPK